MDIIRKYFSLDTIQEQRIAALGSLYADWNAKINVISRKDIDNLYEHHVLHSLAIAKILQFKPQTTILDLGTGGGFPGIPLAIMFPECHFTLLDSVGKKLLVASEVAKSIGLENVDFKHCRIEDDKQKYEFVVSRAVMSLNDLVKLTRKNIDHKQKNALPNGLICLKGGELQNEIKSYKRIATLYDLTEFYQEDYYKTKKAVYLPL